MINSLTSGILVVLLLTSISSVAQQNRYNWRFGLGVGNQYVSGNPYASDSTTSGKVIEFNSNYLAYSAFLELSLSQDFGLKLFTTTRPGDFIPTNSGALLSYYFDNNYLFGKSAFLAPYVNLGVAFGEQSNSFNVPFGGGLKFRLNSRINVNLDYTARTYTSQWRDARFNFGNQLRGYSSLSLHYNFGKKSYSYKAPKPYVSAYKQVKVPAYIQRINIIALKEKSLDTNFSAELTDSVRTLTKGIMVDTSKIVEVADTTALPTYGFAIVPPTTSLKGDTVLVKKAYQQERDSVLEHLQYEIKKQRLQNELEGLKKKDSSASSSYDYPNATPQNSTTEVRITDLRSGGNNYGETADLVGGAAAIGALEIKVSSLQNQVDSLQRKLKKKDLSAATLLVSSEKPDSIPKRQLVKSRAPIDTINIAVVELNLVKQKLKLMQAQMNSLEKIKPTTAQPIISKVEKPKTAFETTGKVAVFFGISSFTLSKEGKAQLDDMVAFANERTEASFLVKGFTDKTGSIQFNRALSLKRAKAVVNYVASKGISRKCLKTVSLGPDQSLGNGSQSFGRRVEVSLN